MNIYTITLTTISTEFEIELNLDYSQNFSKFVACELNNSKYKDTMNYTSFDILQDLIAFDKIQKWREWLYNSINILAF